MRIGIIDAEIVGKNKHRFPNLVCMKLSGYYKRQGHEVELKTDYENIEEYDKIFISKVFIDTEIPCEPKDKTNKKIDTIKEYYESNEFLKNPIIEYGGTGFFYDKALDLPCEIEHCFPDYHLYDDWVKKNIENGLNEKEFEYYTKYSIGYLTRGCFRKCKFCVNKKYDTAFEGSRLEEFIDYDRPYLCFLDDNFFSYQKWKEIIKSVKKTKKPFQFKQGLDERLLTPSHIREIQTWKYKGDLIFAFDNIEDKTIIEEKLNMIYTVCPDFKKPLKFYVLCGYDRKNVYDYAFWQKDIEDLFERIMILNKYGAKPYIMRYENVYKSSFNGLYSVIASWCNQPSIFMSFSFRMFAMCKGMTSKGYSKYKRNVDLYLKDGGKKLSTWRYMEEAEAQFPEIAKRYFDFKPKKKERNKK